MLYPIAFTPLLVKIINSDGINFKTIIDNTAGTSTLRLTSLFATNSDLVNPSTLVFQHTISTVTGIINTCTLDASSGYTAVDPPLDLLDVIGQIQPDNICKWTFVPPGLKLSVKVDAPVGTSEVITIYGYSSILA